MENIMYKPVIGVVMCRNRLKGHQTQTLQEKYLNAIVNAGGLPIALPHAGSTCQAAPAMCSRTFMVKTAMSLTPTPGVIF